MTERIHFTYWSDPLCIWAFVGEDKLEHVFRDFEGSIDVEHRMVPVFGSVLERFATGAWSAGGPKKRCEITKSVAERFGRTEVSGQVWVKDPPASSWPAAAAVKAAFELVKRDALTFERATAYLRQLRIACFVEDRNIARRSVLLDVAEQADLPVEALTQLIDDGTAMARLWEDHTARQALGIQGSPTYVFDDGRAMLYGNVDEGILLATVRRLTDQLQGGSTA